MGCEDIGSYAGPRREFVAFILGVDPAGDCQKTRVGGNSPGPVRDDETLARFVFAPAHLAATGGIDETVVLDAFKCGASVHRALPDLEHVLCTLHHCGEAHAQRIRIGSADRPPQPDRSYLGAVRFLAGEVRALNVDASKARLRVDDTSLPDDRLHGDIVADDLALTKTLRKELRVRLFLLVQQSGLFLSPAILPRVDIAKLGITTHGA